MLGCVDHGELVAGCCRAAPGRSLRLLSLIYSLFGSFFKGADQLLSHAWGASCAVDRFIGFPHGLSTSGPEILDLASFCLGMTTTDLRVRGAEGSVMFVLHVGVAAGVYFNSL